MFTSAANLLCVFSVPAHNNEDSGDEYYCILNMLGCIALVLRNVACTSLLLVYSFMGTTNIPEKIEAEVLTKIEDALANEDSLQLFVEFLRSINRTDGVALIEINELITDYEVMAKQDIDSDLMFQKAKETWSKIQTQFADCAPGFCDVSVIDTVKESLNPEAELDSHLFDQIFGVVINELQSLYEMFKKSKYYGLLAKKQETVSIIVTRMQKVKLV